MANVPSSPAILKAAFIHFESPAAAPQVIVFPCNPETLSRNLQSAKFAASSPAPGAPSSTPGRSAEASVTASVPGVSPAVSTLGNPPAAVTEIINFRMVLDAADLLEIKDPQAVKYGVLPILSALELLVRSATPSSLTVFVCGPNRILPVTILELKVFERLFDSALNPIHAEVDVTLQVLAETEPAGPHTAAAFWNQHMARLRAFAATVYSSSLAPTGIEDSSLA